LLTFGLLFVDALTALFRWLLAGFVFVGLAAAVLAALPWWL
jgi:hypothetical protein